MQRLDRSSFFVVHFVIPKQRAGHSKRKASRQNTFRHGTPALEARDPLIWQPWSCQQNLSEALDPKASGKQNFYGAVESIRARSSMPFQKQSHTPALSSLPLTTKTILLCRFLLQNPLQKLSGLLLRNLT